MRLHIRQHVEEQLIVDLNVGNLHGDLSIETATHLRKNVIDGSRNNATVLVVLRAARHRECLTSACLTVAHNSAIITVDDRGNSLLRAILEHVLLAGIVHQLIELELPVLCLIVDVAAMLILRNLHLDGLHTHAFSVRIEVAYIVVLV